RFHVPSTVGVCSSPGNETDNATKAPSCESPDDRRRCQELPIRIPTRKTNTPPSTTCTTADDNGVSMNLCRTHEMTPNSTSTTPTATPVAVFTFGIKYGSVCPVPPTVVINPQTNPRAHG